MRARLAPLAIALASLAGCCAPCSPPCSPWCAPSSASTALAAVPAAAPALDSDDPAALLATLAAGNDRYRSGTALHARQDPASRSAVATSQRPKVAVLACADSRVAPEVLFDQGLGDLFVVRVAGNVQTDEVTASLEYAVEHLGTRLIVVLGHERCGAVQAALAGGEAPGHLPGLLARLAPAVAAAPPGTPDRENATIAANARLTAEALASSHPVLAEAVAHHHLTVVSAVYDLDTGAVTFAPAPKAGEAPAH